MAKKIKRVVLLKLVSKACVLLSDFIDDILDRGEFSKETVKKYLDLKYGILHLSACVRAESDFLNSIAEKNERKG